MKKFKPAKEIGMKAPSCMAVLAILGEMARRVNENISKVDLKPLQQALCVQNSADSATANS